MIVRSIIDLTVGGVQHSTDVLMAWIERGKIGSTKTAIKIKSLLQLSVR